MKLQKQKYLHDPENGVWGDCDRACLASLLDMDIDEVPHFFDGIEAGDVAGGEEAMLRRKEWLREKGVELIRIVVAAGDYGWRDFVGWVSRQNPGKEFLLVGCSANGVSHVVICRDSEIIHDPALDNSGIVGPCPDTVAYEVEFLVGQLPLEFYVPGWKKKLGEPDV